LFQGCAFVPDPRSYEHETVEAECPARKMWEG
jgi:hypothetical protein